MGEGGFFCGFFMIKLPRWHILFVKEAAPVSSKERYINFFTDFAFKRLFGSEQSKAILLDFLNELLQNHEGKIHSISYLKNEQLGRSEADRRAVYDLYCENDKGEKFIVEIQKTKQKFFKDRTVYYSTFPITEQSQKGEWDYKLEPVYVVAILDFIFDEDKASKEKYRYDVKLCDIETGKVFYDKLTFIYLEMPKFQKTEDELSSRFEKWMYVIRNLDRLDKVPSGVREEIFERFFELAEMSKLSPEEARIYEDNWKAIRDVKNSIDTALEEGEEKGRAEGRAEGERAKALDAARKMLADGVSVEKVARWTGLSENELRG